MNIVYQLNEEHIKQLCELYQGEWWSKGRSLAATQRCVAGSQICVGILDAQEKLIGFVRVLTDYTFKAMIFDVVVAEHHRGDGLGNRLVELVKYHKDLMEVKHFELYCLPEMNEFYVKHGFSSNVGGVQLMRHVNA